MIYDNEMPTYDPGEEAIMLFGAVRSEWFEQYLQAVHSI